MDPRDPDLTTLLHDAVSDVEPADRLSEIRAAVPPTPRRFGWYAAGGGVLAVAAAVTAFAVAVSQDTPRADDPGADRVTDGRRADGHPGSRRRSRLLRRRHRPGRTPLPRVPAARRSRRARRGPGGHPGARRPGLPDAVAGRVHLPGRHPGRRHQRDHRGRRAPRPAGLDDAGAGRARDPADGLHGARCGEPRSSPGPVPPRREPCRPGVRSPRPASRWPTAPSSTSCP